MNKLKTAIRNAEVDGLSDSIIRNFKADEKAQSDSFLKATLEELETLSAQITTAILQDKTLSGDCNVKCNKRLHTAILNPSIF